MKRKHAPLATAFAFALAAGTFACAPAPDNGGGTSSGTGGSSSSGTGGSKGTGGSSGTGGSAQSSGTGGSSTSTGGTTGTGTGGSTSSGTGGSESGTGGSPAGTGGSTSTGTGGTPSTPDAGGGSDTGAAPGGALALTVEGFTAGPNGRNCYPPGSNSMGNISPKMAWGPPPEGIKSWVLTTEDQSDHGPHQVVCNIPVTVLGQEANQKTMIPAGAESGTRHKEAQGNPWYGPGAGNVRPYEIRIWALAVDKLPGGCKNKAGALAAFKYLQDNKANKAVVLASDGKMFWGNVDGKCN